MNFYNIFLKQILPKIKNSHNLIPYFLAAVLASLPLKNIFVSIATILFVLIVIINKQKRIVVKKEYLFPIFLYILMFFSLIWTRSYENSFFGLLKTLPFAVIPIVFILIPKISKESRNLIFKYYSIAMVLNAIFYLGSAFLLFLNTKKAHFFFNNYLVPTDIGSVYMSVFASFALFYFVQLIKKNNLEKICLFFLTIFIFLLSSKSIITIDFIVIIFYYTYFAKIPSGTKALTIISVTLFLFVSVYFVKDVKNRFLLEYETAFIDNTTNCNLVINDNKIKNVSINEALNQNKFQQNNYFPGTALRVYQARIFYEMTQEQNIFFSGFGLESSQNEIRKKAKERNLFYQYGEYNFHNQYIQTFAELGFFGFLILLFMQFLNFKNAFNKKDFLHISFAITMIMLFLTESLFCRQRGIVFFITLYCLFNSFETQKETEKI